VTASDEVLAAPSSLRRLPLLVLSQLLSFAASAGFPILFVRMWGHAAYGDVALAVSYSGLALGLVAGGLGQSILLSGLARRRLGLLIGAFLAAAVLVWGLQLALAPGRAAALALTAVYLLLAQTGVHAVYYYAVRHSAWPVFMLVFPAEAAARIAALLLVTPRAGGSLSALAGCYILSNAAVAVVGLMVMRVRLGGADPEAQAPVDLPAAGRFAKWALSGALIDNFDRTAFATMLPAASRSPYLFFNSLYTAAFSLIANSVALEVLGGQRRARINSRAGLLSLLAFGLGSAGACTALLFAFAAQIAGLTGFDPRPVALAVLYTFAMRALLFTQSLSYGFIERGGWTNRTILPRLIGSGLLAGLGAAVAFIPLEATGAASLAIVGALALAALGWALSAIRAPRL
jgi:hypothetical protein